VIQKKLWENYVFSGENLLQVQGACFIISYIEKTPPKKDISLEKSKTELKK